MISKIKKSLGELGFSENEISVYIALTELGESSAANIAKKADMPRTTAISILEKFRESGYITTHKYRGTTYYWIESPQTIKSIMENKVKIAEELGKSLAGLYRSEADFPGTLVFDTKKSIKTFIAKILSDAPAKSLICTIDCPSAGNYDKVLSREYGKILVGLKNKKGMSTRTLVPYRTLKTINPDKIRTQNIVIKEMPPTIGFSASLWLIGKTLVLFSGHPPFVTAIKNREIVESFRSLYDYLWSISE